MISQATIQRIQDESRVEDVVGEFVALKKRGSGMLGLCPFHNEKTPSFTVSPARNIFKCFGCGKAGGPVQFLMEYQQLSYPDALRYLAKKYNIEIEEDAQKSDEQKQQEQELHNLTESIYIANSYAQKFFTEYMLENQDGKIGLAYFYERGFLKSTIEKFQLGFAPDGKDTFTQHAIKNGFQLDILKKASLTAAKEYGTLDFFRNRVMFPIHNMTGKVVGFGGRIMVKDEKAPKYVNTSENEVYQKSKLLYGIYFSRNDIRKKDECILVEGYTDVISLHQAGIENVVASSGTALTVEQIRLIKRITNNITMLYDGDAAGIKAALRGTDLILEEGMNVRVVILPNGEDPDSFVRKEGFEGFTTFVRSNRKDLISFKAALFAEEARQDPIRKAELIRDVVDSIAKVPDAIQRSVYVKECSQHFDIQEQLLITEVNKARRKKMQQPGTDRVSVTEHLPKDESDAGKQLHKEQQVESSSTRPLLEREIVRVLLEFGSWQVPVDDDFVSVATYVFDELVDVEFQTPTIAEIYKLIKSEFDLGRVHDEKYYIHHADATIANACIEMLAKPYAHSDNWWNKYKIVVPEKRDLFVRDIQSSIMRLKQYINYTELKKVEQMLKNVTDENELKRVMTLHKLLIKQKNEFARTVGNVIYRPNT